MKEVSQHKHPMDYEFTALKLRALFELMSGWEHLRTRVNKYDAEMIEGVQMLINEIGAPLLKDVEEMEDLLYTMHKNNHKGIA